MKLIHTFENFSSLRNAIKDVFGAKDYLTLTKYQAEQVYLDIVRNKSEINNTEKLNQILQHPKLDIYRDGGIVLDMICSNGYLDFFNVIKKHPDFDINFDNDFCLTSAALRGHLELVKTILNEFPSANPMARESHPIRMAIAGNNFQVAKLLLEDERTVKAQVIKDLLNEENEANGYVEVDMKDYLIMLDPSLKSIIDSNDKFGFL
jgi:hypothetical protein